MRTNAPIIVIAFLATLLGHRPQLATAQPLAANIFPKTTCGLLLVEDVPKLQEQLRETNIGTMFAESSLRSLAKDLWSVADDSLADFQKQFDVTLDELFRLATGELAFGVVQRPRAEAGFLLLMNIGEQPEAVHAVREKIEEMLLLQGVNFSTEVIGTTKLSVFRTSSDGGERQLIFCERDQHLLIASALDVAKRTVHNWDGSDKSKPLAQDKSYNRVVKEAMRNVRAHPIVHVYIDPVSLAYALTGGNTAAQAGLAVLPLLGLKDVEGLAVNLAMDSKVFDWVLHAHLLIDGERQGIPAAITLRGHQPALPDWLPADISSVSSLKWEPVETLRAVEKLIDLFRGEETTAKGIKKRLSDPLGFDFEQELLPLFTGQLIRFERINHETITVNPASAIALELYANKTNVATRMLQQIAAKHELEPSQVGATTVFSLPFGRNRRDDNAGGSPANGVSTSVAVGQTEDKDASESSRGEDENRQRRRRMRRQPSPSLAILEDYLLLSDDRELLDQVLTNGKRQPFHQSEVYAQVDSAIRNELGVALPAYLNWFDSRDVWQQRFALMGSEDLRIGMRRRAKDTPWTHAFMKAIDANPLPPFASLSKYFAPGGRVLTNEDNGFHLTVFGLRPELSQP